MVKRIVLAVLGLIVIFIGYRFSQIDATNERVANEIRDNPSGERAAKTMVVTLANGRVYPVNFLWESNQIFMGIDGRWWRAFRGDGQPIAMFVKGQNLTGHARVVLDDPAYTDDIFSRLRPTAPAWLPRWLNGKLVVIDLDDELAPEVDLEAQGADFKTGT